MAIVSCVRLDGLLGKPGGGKLEHLCAAKSFAAAIQTGSGLVAIGVLSPDIGVS